LDQNLFLHLERPAMAAKDLVGLKNWLIGCWLRQCLLGRLERIGRAEHTAARKLRRLSEYGIVTSSFQVSRIQKFKAATPSTVTFQLFELVVSHATGETEMRSQMMARFEGVCAHVPLRAPRDRDDFDGVEGLDFVGVRSGSGNSLG
jgi:hypothetical protein